MANLNVAMLMGNLCRDVELTHSASGFSFGKCSMAINRKWRDSKSNEMKEEVTFVELKFLGKTAETAAQYLHKGSPLFVQGRLSLDSWTDKQTGAKRSKLYVTVDVMQFLEGKRDGQAKPAPAQQAEPAQQFDNLDGGEELPDESAPF